MGKVFGTIMKKEIVFVYFLLTLDYQATHVMCMKNKRLRSNGSLYQKKSRIHI